MSTQKRGVFLSISQFIKTLYMTLPQTWPSILSILLVYIFFWKMDQGQAIIEDIASYENTEWNTIRMPIFLLFSSFFLAFINAYIPIYRIKKKNNNKLNSDEYLVPLLLGSTTILVAGLWFYLPKGE